MKKYLLLAILLLIPKPSLATFSRVNFVSVTGTAGLAFPSVVAGHLLVFQNLTFSSPTTSVTGDNGNTWVHAAAAQCMNGSITQYVDTFYVLSATAGTTTATPTSTASFGYSIGIEYAYTGSSPGFDQAICGTGGGVFASSLSLITTYNNELLVALAAATPGAATAGPSGWANFLTSTASYNDASANLLDAGTNGTKSANFTFDASSQWVETLIAFRDNTTSSGGADTLSFAAQPTNVASGSTFSPTVVVNLNLSGGGIDTGSSAMVTLTISACGASLTGTASVMASAGVATFTGLGATTGATGCTLTAASAGIVPVASSSFNVSGAGTGITYIGACINGTTGALTCTPMLTSNGGLTLLFTNFTVTATQDGNWSELSSYVTNSGGVQNSIRLAVYRASDNRLEAQGNSTILVVGAGSPTWQGHMMAGAITQYHAAVNGTAYRLGLTFDAVANLNGYFDPAGSSGDANYSTTVYITGWPDPAPSATNASVRLLIRAAITNGSVISSDNLKNRFATLGVGR